MKEDGDRPWGWGRIGVSMDEDNRPLMLRWEWVVEQNEHNGPQTCASGHVEKTRVSCIFGHKKIMDTKYSCT